MGQKIHPLGFRVGITKSHQSQWFARFHKHQYASSVLEDRLLRQTLLKLFPELLNPVVKKAQKRDGDQEILPKITHIKIERGLIPYEIGIQIHAGNCELIKSAIDNLQVNQNLVHNLQKTRRYLLDLNVKLKDSLQISSHNESALGASSNSSDRDLSVFEQNTSNANKKRIQRQKLAQNRLRKRKTMGSYFRENLLENMMIVKKDKKIIRKLQKKLTSAGLKSANGSKFNRSRTNETNSRTMNKKSSAKFGKKTPSFTSNKMSLNASNTRSISKLSMTAFGQSQNTKKFVDIFMTKMNQKFLKTLKIQMNEWNQFLKSHKENQIQKYGVLRYAPLGYQKKWSLSRLNRLQKQPVNILSKLLKSLQKKALLKLETLQKDFSVLGTISKIESFNYYQMIRFIKSLKQLVQQLKAEQQVSVRQKTARTSFDASPQMQRKLEKSLLSLTEKALRKKFQNIDDECRKIKFIDYLQNVVKKHRQKNIFLYLSTISDSRKYLRQIQKFTKQQASFLFGLNLQSIRQLSPEKQHDQIKAKVKKAIQEANRKNIIEKNLQAVFLEQLQKQRTVCRRNIELTPKISMKFYSVKSQNLETKATIVADSIVDDLEKRKAFRRVIKQAKETLMTNSKVKGVKIQVSGRLNGAEIARSEWVRAGRVPLQTLRANIDYCYKTASTIYGIIGVKVWIYKGYTKLRKSKKSPNLAL
uniref:Small ribosomal subunit protein uS3c n=1 Tax=Bracteacoccus giganteus TaxID=50039 RepID=A0A0S2LQY6_9CHLO|nr:ribosomal protein S3 [Bracteacoccus giganteus]ALO63544.1 ribosomal protein S3 [Bracteacoccus giganteus]